MVVDGPIEKVVAKEDNRVQVLEDAGHKVLSEEFHARTCDATWARWASRSVKSLAWVCASREPRLETNERCHSLTSNKHTTICVP